MMGFAVLVGQAIALRGQLLPIPSILGYITAFTLTSSSMVLNDFYDRAVDKVNEPERPIPKGIIKPGEAVALATVLAIVGLLTAFATNITSLLVAALSFALAAFYNMEGKKKGLLGNLMVSGTVAVPFIYGSFIVDLFPSPLLLLFALLAFLSNTGREVIKGIADTEGDKLRRVKTLAITLGEKKSAVIASLFYGSAVTISFIPAILNIVSVLYVPFVIVTDAGFASAAALILKRPNAENARRIKKLSLFWMFTGLVAFVVGGL